VQTNAQLLFDCGDSLLETMDNATLVGTLTTPVASGSIIWQIYAGVVKTGENPQTDALPIIDIWCDSAIELPADLTAFVLKTRRITGSDVLTTVEPSLVTAGKNRGKKNQTNKYTQALRDAKGALDKRSKKKDDSYIHPMLATELELDELESLPYPVIVQEKLDGVRVIISDNKLWSRGGTQLPVPDHLIRDLALLTATGLAWDGELFAEYPLQKVSGAARRAKPKTEAEQRVRDALRVHIYDVIDPAARGTYLDRLAIMEERLPVGLTGCLLVPSQRVDGPEPIRERFQDTIAAGKEGLIIRIIQGPQAGPYEQSINAKRSKQLYKLKAEYSAEGIIVDVIPGTRGRDATAAIFIIDTIPSTFPARFQHHPSARLHVVPNATIPERKQMLKDAKKYVGLPYTFTFQDVSQDGEPLRARGIATREPDE
jgi:hypothetical protein